MALHAIIPEEDRSPNACLARAVDEAVSGSAGSTTGGAVGVQCPLPRISLQKRKLEEVEGGPKSSGSAGGKCRRTLSRSPKSFLSLSAMFHDDDDDRSHSGMPDRAVYCSMEDNNLMSGPSPMTTATSLEFQLKFLAPDDLLGNCEAAPCIIFPNLPTTVSDSSWSSADFSKTRAATKTSKESPASDQECSDAKERYGWFVVLDKDISEPRTGCSAYKSTLEDLAFSAPTPLFPLEIRKKPSCNGLKLLTPLTMF